LIIVAGASAGQSDARLCEIPATMPYALQQGDAEAGPLGLLGDGAVWRLQLRRRDGLVAKP
jgi:hypothetical protein